MDILAEVLDRVRLGGTLLFHFDLGHPWSLALPRGPTPSSIIWSAARRLSRWNLDGSSPMTEGDFVVVTRGEPHVIYSDRRTKPFPIVRYRSTLRLSRHSFVMAAAGQPLSTMICGNFTVSRPSRGSVLELLPPVLLLKAAATMIGSKAILQRMVGRARRFERPGQRIALSRNDGSAIRRSVAKLDQVSPSWRRRMAGAMADPPYRACAPVDPRTTGSALDPS